MLHIVALIPLVCGAEYTEKFAFWHTDYGVACRDAVLRDRPLFVIFCPGNSTYGRAARGGLFMNEAIERSLRDNYVRLCVDTSSETGAALARRFQINSNRSFVVLDRTARWTVYQKNGDLSELDLGNMLAQYRRSKLGADGRPVVEMDVASRAGSGAAATTQQPTDSIRTLGYRTALVRNIDESAFEREVIEQSRERTVIVDFWAEWCGPCRALAPLLERQVRERDGDVVLVKVNVDKAPNLTARYRVESIPAVKAFRDGKPVLEFVGMQSEDNLRQVFDRLKPNRIEQVGSTNDQTAVGGVAR